MNVFALARECFNEPEQYSIATTKIQIYASLLVRNQIDLDEFLMFVEDVKGDAIKKASAASIIPLKRYFKLIENTAKVYVIENS